MWDQLGFDEVRLSHATALLVLQGLPPQKVFTPDTWLLCMGETISKGPFILLKANFCPHDTPPRLTGVVLACVNEVPEGAEREAFGVLVSTVMGA